MNNNKDDSTDTSIETNSNNQVKSENNMPPLLLNFDFNNLGNLNFNNEKDLSATFPFSQSHLLKSKPNNRTLSQALYKISQLNAISNNNSGLLLIFIDKNTHFIACSVKFIPFLL
jgi:hypothetical protein